ncbi:MAG: AI-2E family transporter [Deltaproteobacteria bacterium]|nr:AI-2E family transporter [Deltaproteobacteria bacterium]
MGSSSKPSALLVVWRRASSILTRIVVWCALFGILFLLRSFFLLIFLTFVFAYIQYRAVVRLEPFVRCRALRVVISGLVFLAGLITVGNFMLPPVAEQARLFANSFGVYLRAIDNQLLDMSKSYPIMSEFMPQLGELAAHESYNEEDATWRPEGSASAALLQQLFGFGEVSTGHKNVQATLDRMRRIGQDIFGMVSAFLLSLLFSFLIVFDLERLTALVRGLEDTKLRFAYREVGPGIYHFAAVLGQALEAQFFIALLNTTLTAAGLWLLGLTSKLAFFLLIVFLCSFIPIAGVFISSVPICLLALQQEGLGMMFMAAGMITVIHLIEAYVLNPRIFGHHLRLNPVLVLIILTMGGELFGVWGLVLGLPVSNYFFKYAIRSDHAPVAAE